MSERRSSDGSDGDRLNHSFEFDDQAMDSEVQRAFAQEMFAARSAGFLGGVGGTSDDGDDTTSEHYHRDRDDASSVGSGSTSRSNASRLLEALEALSQDTGGDGNAIPPSLRGLLGQLNGSGDGAAMMGGLFPFAQLLEGSGSPRFQRTLEAISAQSPTHVQMSGLSELCETLSLSSEEVLVMSGFSVDKFVPAVVTLIRFPPTMDVLLLACRALSSILELFPGNAIPKAIAEGVLPSLCEKLMEIEYMDVAELALQILERVVCKPETLSSQTAAAEYRHAVIQENGFVALLQFVDFFPIEIQRSAARIVCQLCMNFPTSMAGKLRQGLPLITNLLQSFDSEILQNACECFQKLGASKSFTESTEIARMVADESVCEILVKLLATYGSGSESTADGGSGANHAQLPPAGYTSILRFMSSVLSSSSFGDQSIQVSSNADLPLVAKLRFLTLPPIVTTLLAKKSAVSDNQFLRDTLKLVIVLLPIADELKSMESVPEPVVAFAHEILPSIIRVYDSTSRSDLRYECLGVIYRSCSIIYLKEEPFTCHEHAELSRLAAFLARVLRPKATSSAAVPMEKDLLPVHLALQIIEASLTHESAREVVTELFERHGIATAIRYYADCVSSNTDSKPHDTYEVLSSSSRLVADYFGKVSSETSLLVQLQVIVNELQQVLTAEETTSHMGLESSIQQVLQKMQAVVSREEDSVTAHEIASSGLVKTLTRTLTVSEGKRAFRNVFLGAKSGAVGPLSNDFVSCLVQCIQDAIASEKDAFSSEYTGSHPSSGQSSVSNDLDQLTQHIKVRVLVEEEDSKEPAGSPSKNEEQNQVEDDSETTGNWFKKRTIRRSSGLQDAAHQYKRNKKSVHDTVVLVEPLARIETMEEFIADKLFGTRSSASILDDLAGRSNGDDENEQKEGDDDEVKEKKIQAIYKGHTLPADVSILEAIVKFSKNAEAGNGKCSELPDVFETTNIELNRIWSSSPHEITFRVLSPSSATKQTDSNSDDANKDTSFDLPAKKDELKVTASLAFDRQWWDNVWDLLILLKLVRELVLSSQNMLGTQLLKDRTLMFTNSFLCLQVNRVLQQPVRVVTNALPSWSFRLVNDYAFVLDYDTRYHFTYATSCGSSRAIQYLCRSVWKAAVMEEPLSTSNTSVSGRHGTSSRRRTRDGGSRSRTAALMNISRMVKLPRLKVRVARSRLLQSAMKLLAIYGGKKAVIEIEFLGEVGTGLGPTTEFFTLICQEIQSKHLKMWRDEDKVPSPDINRDGKSEEHGEGEEKADDAFAKQDEQPSLPIRGYHRVAVYHCPSCTRIRFPRCSVHQQLLTHEDTLDKKNDASDAMSTHTTTSSEGDASKTSIPQCSQCLDSQDWYSSMATCDCGVGPGSGNNLKETAMSLKWWILSDEEVQYLAKVYPRKGESVKHPVLQCAHCDTVNFPGTDAGIVVMDGDRMLSRSGRRMYERDYRAVTKHVSPLCEGTPLNTMVSLLTREQVDVLVEAIPKSPEVLESEVESLNYLNETSLFSDGGPAVVAPHGLFPKSYLRATSSAMEGDDEEKAPEAPSSSVFSSSLVGLDVLSWFTFLGRFVAQALLDERLLNLPFSRPFLRALRGERLAGKDVDVEVSIGYVYEFDPSIGTSLKYLYDIVRKYAQKTFSGQEGEEEDEDVRLWRDEVESMCLSFTLVGDSSIELRPDGTDVDVTLETLLEYVEQNVVFLLDTTIAKQVAAFQQGFEQICGSSWHQKHFLRVFDVEELEQMFSDTSVGSSMWDREGHELREHTVCDHGYTPESKAIGDLIAILCDFTMEEQRLFVRFVTGANRLPVGGLAKLEPKLTVVRKLTESSTGTSDDGGFLSSDAVLPSASTCTNYLKLPEYSTREVMKERLLYCIHEGQGSFHLS
uniref:HECT-type E3 ubiquitin transferase n=1 Tax=Globisporangium ultimum (strain ATCC 200006 / CBS 805.95 / DAOM BR144) TaxID=431595 RepID=K3WXK9_GLOUD